MPRSPPTFSVCSSCKHAAWFLCVLSACCIEWSWGEYSNFVLADLREAEFDDMQLQGSNAFIWYGCSLKLHLQYLWAVWGCEQPQQWKKVLPLACYRCFPRDYHLHIFGNLLKAESLFSLKVGANWSNVASWSASGTWAVCSASRVAGSVPVQLMGKGEHLRMLPFPAGTAVSRSVAWLPKIHFTVPCIAATASLTKYNSGFAVAATLLQSGLCHSLLFWKQLIRNYDRWCDRLISNKILPEI